MHRVVTAELDLELGASVDLILQIAVGLQVPVVRETLTIMQGERDCVPTELIEPSGSRLHRLAGQPGPLTVRYDATITERAPVGRGSDLDALVYLRPSRYAPSDELFAHARRQFAGLQGLDLIAAVSDAVATTTTYAPGLSLGTDSAVTTLATGRGVCRDYAHLVIAMLRAMDVPARYVSCYAPGLQPMDFHAVAEAYHEGNWYVIDATRLANRHALVRIATGRDAADCAFISSYGGHVGLTRMHVDAWASLDGRGGSGTAASDDDPFAPARDDITQFTQIV